MPPIRILHVFGKLNKGGAETRTMDIYRGIDKSLIQFDFAVHTNEKCAYDDEILSKGGLLHKGIPRFRFFNGFSYFKAWDRFFNENPYDIVHIHTTNSAAPILVAARNNWTATRIVHARNSYESSLLRRLFVALNRRSIVRLSTNRLAVSDLAGKFIFGKGYSVIPNAIDASKFSYNINYRNSIRDELGIKSCFVIGNVARFHYQKNHFFLLDAFSEARRTIPSAKLLLVGDGELKDAIRSRIKELGMDEDVMMLGVRDDIDKILSAIDIFVLPSRYEGLPGVALEAQAAGLRTLLSDKITREAVVAGDLVDFISIDQGASLWAEKIVDYYNNIDYNRRETYEEFVEAGFDVKSAAAWYENFYTDIYKEREV
ncbi:MAG: glycosyltransferase family 1 protein [Clostridiales bacterium]|nr:glycosyltransferase family 1 protein [Clostridiales bacterium]